MKALLVGSGSINKYDRLMSSIEEVDYIICADGGLDHLLRVNVDPDIIIGDLDSITREGLEYIEEKSIEVLKFPPIKDKTDTELALDFIIDRGFKEVILMGVSGSRLDHTLGSVFLLDKLLREGIKSKLVDDKNTIFIVNDYLSLERIDNTYVSIIPLKGRLIVSLKGFFYNLDKVLIEFSSSLGISNEITSEFGQVFIHEGTGLVIISQD